MSVKINDVAIRIGEVSVSVQDMLAALHGRRQLLPLLRKAAFEAQLLHAAQVMNVVVSNEELQTAANRFRQRQGLASAQQTHAWLTRNQLSERAFELALERAIVLRKVRILLTKDKVAEYFSAHRAEFDRARVRQIRVDRLDLAEELRSQLLEGSVEFADLVRQYAPSPTAGEVATVVLRCDLPADFASAIFEAPPGEPVGPLASDRGFHLFTVEAIEPAQLDRPIAEKIGKNLLAAWFRERLAGTETTFPLLAELP